MLLRLAHSDFLGACTLIYCQPRLDNELRPSCFRRQKIKRLKQGIWLVNVVQSATI